jgi:hypothetical protein
LAVGPQPWKDFPGREPVNNLGMRRVGDGVSLCIAGTCRLYPLFDVAEVNVRRHAVGLDPLTEQDLAAAYTNYTDVVDAVAAGTT